MSIRYPILPGRLRGVGWSPGTDAIARLRSPRRVFQVALGLIWLLDAALQYQPYMFTPAFVHQIILPSTVGNPGWILASETWAAAVMLHHVALYNAMFATIQLGIAGLILWRPTVKLGLVASVAWALGVWWFGEGLGGVLTGASPLAGLPGGALLYALIAVLVWPRADEELGESVATSGLLRPAGARLAWLVLWGGFACFLVIPVNRSPMSVHSALVAASSGEPGWFVGADHSVAGALAGSGLGVAIGLAVCCALVAASSVVPALRRAGVLLAVLIGCAIWFAEDVGGIFTGTGTDPNSGMLLALLAVTFWPFAQVGKASDEPQIGAGGAVLPARVRDQVS